MKMKIKIKSDYTKMCRRTANLITAQFHEKPSAFLCCRIDQEAASMLLNKTGSNG